MSLIVLGISHHTASVALREQLAFDAARAQDASLHAREHAGFASLLVLSTCNRTEFYTLADTPQHVLAWLAEYSQLDLAQLQAHSYLLEGTDALTHMIRVTSGLDSMILGEPQIFGQFKQAVSQAQQHDMLNKQMTWLSTQVISATKKVRSETRIGEQVVSLGFAVAKLAQQIFDNLSQNTLLLVASGEMNQLVARHMCQSGIGKVVICNRSIASAQRLAEELTQTYSVTVEVEAWSQLADVLVQGDIISASTGSLQTVIHYKAVKRAIKQRRYAPMLIVDLAVPRDVEDKVARLDDVYHYAIDDLQRVIDGNIQQRREASVNAEVMISQMVVDIQARQRVKEAGHNIAAYQNITQQLSHDMQQKALQQLAQGKPAEQVVQELVHQLTAKLTHRQFKLLRDAASLPEAHILEYILPYIVTDNDD